MLNDPNEPIRRGHGSPWGSLQHVSTLVPLHIHSACTAGHGGIHLSAEYNRRVPAYMRANDGWYEEDCDWSIPFIIFADQIVAHARNEEDRQERTKNAIEAKVTLRNWHPASYERFYSVKLAPGDSTSRDIFTQSKSSKGGS